MRPHSVALLPPVSTAVIQVQSFQDSSPPAPKELNITTIPTAPKELNPTNPRRQPGDGRQPGNERQPGDEHQPGDERQPGRHQLRRSST